MTGMCGWDRFAHQLLAQRLAAGGCVRLTVTTRSMAPFLLPGDCVTLAPVSVPSLRAGDIVARPALPRPIVHRLVAAPGRWGGQPLITKGDAGRTYDRPLPPQTVLGRVVAVQRGDSVLPLTTRKAHFGALLLAALSCLSAGPIRLPAWLPTSLLRRATQFLLRQAMRIPAGLIWRTCR